MEVIMFFVAAANQSAEAAVSNVCCSAKSTMSAVFDPICAFLSKVEGWIVSNWVELLFFAVGIVLSVIVALIVDFIISLIARKLAAKTASDVDDHLLQVLRRPLLLAVIACGVACSTNILPLPESAGKIIIRILYAILSWSLVWVVLKGIGAVGNRMKLASKLNANANLDELLIDLISRVVKAAVWVIAIIFVAQNLLGLNVTALITGASVIGLAVAFAAQNTIANIFGAVAIIIDKPFTIGDRIIANGKDGIVQSVGLRSTTLRALDGTSWTVPNKELSDASIQNMSHRPNFKQELNIGLTYSTTPEQLEEAKNILHEIVADDPMFDMPPRISFNAMKDWSLNIQMLMWFKADDFLAVLKRMEEINFEILRRFNAAGLEIAFPTSTTYIAGDAKNPLIIKNQEK